MSEKKKKTIIIVGAIVAVLVIVYIFALLTGNVKQQEPSEPSNTPKPTVSTPIISDKPSSYGWNPSDSSEEVGSTARADEIQLKGMNDAKNISEDDVSLLWEEGLLYLKDHSDNFFESNDIMEKSLYYGSFIYNYIEENSPAQNVSELSDSVRAAYDGAYNSVIAIKYVYRGVQTIEDKDTQTHLKKAQENLAKFG